MMIKKHVRVVGLAAQVTIALSAASRIVEYRGECSAGIAGSRGGENL